MNTILLIIFSASVFSIEGLGQEQTIFNTPFYGDLKLARIEFSLKPEFNLLNENSDFRALFWTNPFFYGLKIPIYRGLTISFGNLERYNQTFDIYGKIDSLEIYAQGRGGIEELYIQLNQKIDMAEFFFRGAYLYGSSREIWNYTIGGYSISDTFSYKNNGWISSAGLKLYLFSFYYEGLGRLKMQKSNIDTTYNLPQLLGAGIEHRFKDWTIALFFEHLSGEGFNGLERFKIMTKKERFGLHCSYNPWYIGDIREYLIGGSFRMGIKNFATISLNISFGMRTKETLREFTFIPELNLILEEIFARRRK